MSPNAPKRAVDIRIRDDRGNQMMMLPEGVQVPLSSYEAWARTGYEDREQFLLDCGHVLRCGELIPYSELRRLDEEMEEAS